MQGLPRNLRASQTKDLVLLLLDGKQLAATMQIFPDATSEFITKITFKSYKFIFFYK